MCQPGILASLSRHFTLFAVVMITIGCTQQDPGKKDDPVTIADSIAAVFFVDHIRYGQRELCLAFTNTGSTPIHFDRIELSGFHAQTNSEVSVSSYRLEPREYEYVRLSMDESVQHNAATIAASIYAHSENGSVIRSDVKFSKNLSLDSVQLADGLHQANIYLSTEQRLPSSDAIRVLVDGREARMLGTSHVNTRGGMIQYCMQIKLPQPLKTGNEITVQVSTKDGRQYGGVATALRHSIQATNQYCFPLRVTRADSDRQGNLALEVYNESSKLKTKASILGIRIDDEDVTEKCTIPKDPLPPDHQNYVTDARTVLLPRATLSKDVVANGIHVVIDYEQHDASFGQQIPEIDRRGSHAVRIRDGLEFPIGVKDSIYLEDFACLGNEGLREALGVEEYAARAHEVCEFDSSVPTYANLVDGRDISEVAAVARYLDFVVVAPPFQRGPHLGRLNNEFIDYLEEMARREIPYALSLTPNSDGLLSQRGVDYRALLALAMGGKSVLVPADFSRTRLLFGMDHKAAMATAQLLAASQPFPAEFKSQTPGVLIKAIQCDPDRILVFVINQWCILEGAIPNKTFHGSVRQTMDLAFDFGDLWRDVTVTDLATSDPVETKLDSSGWTTIRTPEFELGCVVLIERSGSSDIGIPTWPSLHSANKVPAIVSISPPFFFFENDIPGSKVHFTVDLSSVAKDPCDIELLPSDGFEVDIEKRALAPGETTRLSIQTTVPRTVNYFEGSVAVSARGVSSDHLSIFLAGKPRAPVVAEPPAIDFGQITSGEGTAKRITLRGGGEPFSLYSAVSNKEFVEVKPENDFQLLVLPKNPPIGIFQGTITVVTKDFERDEPYSFEIPFRGSSVETLYAVPRKIVIPQQAVPCSREFTIESDREFAISEIQCNAGWLQVRKVVESKRQKRFLVTIADVGTSQRRQANIRVRSDIGTCDISVAVVGQAPETRSKPPQGPAARNGRVATLARKVGEVLEKHRSLALPRDVSNWVLIHHLLSFADGSSNPQNGEGEFRRYRDLLLEGNEFRPSPFAIVRGAPRPKKLGDRFDIQHHPDQALAYLSLCGLGLTDSLVIDGKSYKIADLLNASKEDVRPTGADLSWTLIAYSRYVSPDEIWKNKFGEALSLKKLLNGLLASERDKQYCDGTHRLFALAQIAANEKVRKDPDLRSQLTKVNAELKASLGALQKIQVPSGRFFGEQDRITGTIDQLQSLEIQRQGHRMEWVVAALNDEELVDEWVLKGVEQLAETLQDRKIPGGLLDSVEGKYHFGFRCHAMHALASWHRRVAPRD